MRIYKNPNSSKWWVDWRDQNGRRHRKSTGTEDKELAQALAAKWQQDNFMERHFGVIPDIPFREALIRYGQERKRENGPAYEDNVRYRLQLLLDHFDDLNVGDIKLQRIQAFTDMRFQTVKNGTVQKELATLKAILNKAFREGYLDKIPPFPKLKPVQGRTRWLTLEEDGRLLNATKDRPHLHSIVQFALDTGGRRSEVLGLDWRNVDLKRGFVTFTQTKNGEDRAVRLTERAKRVLKELEPKKSGPVFTFHGRGIRSVKTAFTVAVNKAGLEDFRFHDLRHTFASRLVQQGVSLYEVMHLTGHKSFQMVQRYAHLSPEFQERAIAALEAYGKEEREEVDSCPENIEQTNGHKKGTVPRDPALDKLSLKRRKAPVSRGFSMVGATGIEPVTPAV